MANTKITNPELFNLGDSTSATQLPVMTTTERIAMNAPPTLNIDYLVVAGGGGGGLGGGGAGGYRTSFGTGNINGGNTPVENALTLATGSPGYTVTIGAGGAGIVGNGTQNQSDSGNNSVFSSITSTGGGGAGTGGASGSFNAGVNGGSGGGSHNNYTAGAAVTNPTQGFSGGIGTNATGGGGGGAGGAGNNNTTGGVGLDSLITGTSTPYAGGGGGYPSGAASYGGGAAGGAGTGSSAAANTGAGGGGGVNGGAGGSGVVILRYTTADVASYTATGLTPTEDTTTIPGQTILSFTTVGTGTITFTSSTPIGTISTGEMIFNSTTDKVEYWDGTKWYGITYKSEADLFGDGSNMFTSNFSNSTPDVIEGNGASIFVDTGTMGFDSNVPRPGFVKSLVGTANQVNQRFDWSLQTGYAPSACKAYSFWVYNTRIDDDDNLILSVNIKRQNYSTMWVYAWDSSGTNEQTHDQFSTLSTNAWHHMTVVDEGTTMRTYIDGVSAGTHTIASSSILLRTAYPILYQLSDADARNTMFTTGIRMFDRPLTAAEVTTLYDEDPDYGA